jgi:Ankyrin repeats (many copies)/Ankyrin repeats (3 copies)
MPQFVVDQTIRQIEENLPQRSWTEFSSEDFELLWRPFAGSILLTNHYGPTQSRELTLWWISRVGNVEGVRKVGHAMSQDALAKWEDASRAEDFSVVSTLDNIPSFVSLPTDKRQRLHDTNNLVGLVADLRQNSFPILHILAKESSSNQAPIVDALGKAGAIDMDETFGAPGLSPLHVAARFGNKKVAASLLLHGANINKTTGNFWKWTALYFAVEYENWEMLEYLLSWSCRLRPTCKVCNSKNICKANVWARDGRLFRRTVVHIAALKSVKTLRPLLRHNRFLAQARDNRGNTPLHEAAFGQRLDCVKALVAAGADPNAADVLLGTPLHSVYKLFEQPGQALFYCRPDKKEQEKALELFRDLQNKERLLRLIANGTFKSVLTSLQALDKDSTVLDARQIIRFLVDHAASRRSVDALGCTPEIYSYVKRPDGHELTQFDMLGFGYCTTPSGNSWAAEDSDFGPQGCWERIVISLPETGITAPNDTLENMLYPRNGNYSH